MNSNQHIDPEDLALFALGFLSPEESARIRRQLEEDAAGRQELADIRGDLASYALTAEMHSPPAMARDRLLQQIAREPKTKPTAPSRIAETAAYTAASQETGNLREMNRPAPAYRSRLTEDDLPRRSGSVVGKVIPWIGWAVAAGLAITAGEISHDRDGLRSEVASARTEIAQVNAQTAEARRLMETFNDPSAQRVTLTLSKQAPVPQARATYVPSTGRLLFTASNMEPLEPYKTYELWIIPANGQDPVAAGLFHPDAKGNASIVMPPLPPGITAKAFGITIEDEGGSRTPTMPIVMAGAAG